MLKNLVKSLILTEDPMAESTEENAAKVKGRVVTTLPKAKEARSLAERCITIAKKGLQAEEAAKQYATDAERNSDEWQSWRKSDRWQKWADAIAPAVAARRRVVQLLSERGDRRFRGDKRVVRILFEDIAPRYKDRSGGYTRVVQLADRRLGDAGKQAILEFVGVHDRVTAKAEAPAFEEEGSEAE